MVAVIDLAVIWMNAKYKDPVMLQVYTRVSPWQYAHVTETKLTRWKQTRGSFSQERTSRQEYGILLFLRTTSHDPEHGTLSMLLHCGWTGGCCPKSKACLQRLAAVAPFYCVLPGRERQRSNDVFWFMEEQINCSWHSTGQAVFHTMG
jgi:hypothetical protein